MFFSAVTDEATPGRIESRNVCSIFAMSATSLSPGLPSGAGLAVSCLQHVPLMVHRHPTGPFPESVNPVGEALPSFPFLLPSGTKPAGAGSAIRRGFVVLKRSPGLPQMLAKVIEKSPSSDPLDRFQTLADFLMRFMLRRDRQVPLSQCCYESPAGRWPVRSLPGLERISSRNRIPPEFATNTQLIKIG